MKVEASEQQARYLEELKDESLKVQIEKENVLIEKEEAILAKEDLIAKLKKEVDSLKKEIETLRKEKKDNDVSVSFFYLKINLSIMN